MRKPYFILLVASMIATSCVKTRHNVEPYGWEAVDPTFDSLTCVAEKLIVDNQSQDTISKTIDRMISYADTHPDKKIFKSRALFFKGHYIYTFEDTQKGDSIKRVALEMTDSARYPYDAHRILYFLDNDYHEPTVERYNSLRNEFELFLKSGDKLWGAALGTETGMFLADIGDTRNGEEYLNIADSLFLAGGFIEQYSNNRINRANLLQARKDTAGAVKLMHEILADKKTPISRFTRHIVLGNLYSLSGDTAALHEAFRNVINFTNSEDFTCQYASCLASEKIALGQIDSARYYLDIAKANKMETPPQETYLCYLKASHNYFNAINKPDSAYRYLLRESELREEMADEYNRSEINNVTLNSKIEKLKLEADIEKHNVVILYLSIILSIIIVVSVAAYIIYRKLQRQKLKTVEAKLVNERMNRKNLAMETVLKEKENMLHNLEHKMHEMLDNGEINGPAVKKIGMSMKIHLSQQEQRDTFIETFETVSPKFLRHLKETYPSLTESDVRLASYIAMGMDNKHIARVMSIRPESVKQARWRLRSKMGLKSGESLDDLMRQLATTT